MIPTEVPTIALFQIIQDVYDSFLINGELRTKLRQLCLVHEKSFFPPLIFHHTRCEKIQCNVPKYRIAVRLPACPPERARHDAVVILLAQATRGPPVPPRIQHLVVQIYGPRDQNLRLLRQARHMHRALYCVARTAAHEAFSSERMHGLETYVAFLPLRVDRACLDRDRDGLLVFFVGVKLFRVAAAVYFLTDLLVAAAPVVMLASGITISREASHASRRVVGQWGGAGGAVCE